MKERSTLRIIAIWLGIVSLATAALVWAASVLVARVPLSNDGYLEKILSRYFKFAALGIGLYGIAQWAGAWMLRKDKKHARHLLIWPSLVFVLWPVPIVVQSVSLYPLDTTVLMLTGGWTFFALFFGWYIYRAFRL